MIESKNQTVTPESKSRPSKTTGASPVSAEEQNDVLEEQESEQNGDTLVSDIGSLKEQASEYLALAQRTQADFENYRKRVTRDAALAETRGIARLTKELLPALDHFELAIRSQNKVEEGEQSGELEEVTKGFQLIHDEFLGALERVGVQRFSPLGEQFDPNEHEAMVQQPSESAKSGTIIEVYQQGYRINGTILRPARVVVAA